MADMREVTISKISVIFTLVSFWFLFCLFVFYSQHLEVPRLWVELEQLLAYTTATARWDLSCDCELYHNSGQRWIPNQMSEARN